MELELDLLQEENATERSVDTTKAEADFVLDMMDMLTAPLIVHKSPWAQDIPDRLREDVMTSRMIAAMKGERKATWAEVTAYLMPASFDGPLQHEWANIYLYASAQYIRECRPEQADSVDFAPETLDSYETSLLERLRRRIYEKRREIVKREIKASERRSRTEETQGVQEELPLAAG